MELVPIADLTGPAGPPGDDGADGADGGTIPKAISAQTGTTYTFVLADADNWVTLSNVAAIALTVPTNAAVAFPVGTELNCSVPGAGQVTIAGAGGVTVNSRGTRNKSNGQHSVFGIKKTATDTWVLFGDLTT